MHVDGGGSAEVRAAALRRSEETLEDRLSRGVRDGVNVLRCTLRTRLPNGGVRAWRIAVALPSDPAVDNPRMISGKISATGIVSGDTVGSNEVDMTVNARSLSGFGYFTFETPGLHDLPVSEPASHGDLGDTQFDFITNETSLTMVGSGPNEGYNVHNEFPIDLGFDVYVNYSQFEEGSYIWNQTPTNPPPGICTRAEIASPSGLRQDVLDHEGDQYQTNSHTGWSRTHLQGMEAAAKERMEAWVYTGIPTWNERFEAATEESWSAHYAANQAAVHGAWEGCQVHGLSN